MSPTSGGEVFENFGAIGQMHECPADVVFEVAVAELDKTGVLLAIGPADGFEFPRRAFEPRVIAIVGREEKRRAGLADLGKIL